MFELENYRGYKVQPLGHGRVQVFDPQGNHVAFTRDNQGDVDAAIELWEAYRSPLPEEKGLPTWLQRYNARQRGIKKRSRI